MLETEPSETDIQMTLPFDAKAEPVDWRTQVPSVSQLTRRVRGHIENAFFDVWVKGEISNLRKPGSGHVYFCLKDATAQLKAVMFRMSFAKLKFQVQDGMEILLHGKVTVYEARGEYQMVADNMEPVGVGALQLAFEQLKQRLHKEGLFDPRHKKKLPALPKRIGIVTSPTGAAVKDILKVLGRRFPDRDVVIFPASVQGDKAAPEICRALELTERWNRERPDRKLDVLIVGRGGGSLEDLWCFNEESVARALFACPIPVISAVGHEIDFTIADFVADVRAPTPSAAAEIVVPRKDELVERVGYQTSRLAVTMAKRLEQLRLHLGHLGQRLIDPRQKIRLLRHSHALLFEKLGIAMRTRLRLARRQLEAEAAMLHTLSPLQVLSRGYALARREGGGVIHSVKDVQIGDRVTARVADGTLTTEVLSIDREPL